MLPALFRRALLRRRQLAVALLAPVVLAWAPPAVALSRAMWAEFNAIYLINLKPATECRPYRTRSIELLKDTSLSPAALDERMHALWNEAKVNCLAKPAPEQPSARQQPDPATAQPRTAQAVATAANPAPAAVAAKAPEPAPAPIPAKPAAEKPPVAAALPAPAHAPAPAPAAAAAPAAVAAPAPAAAPAAAPAPTAGTAPYPAKAPTPPGPAAAGPITTVPAGDATAGEHSPATGGRGNAAPGTPMQSTPGTKAPGDGRPPIALPQLKPAIERPLMVDLRLEAACAKRNPYAYQVASDDDPCAKLASAKAAKADPAATGVASPAPRTSAWVLPVAGVVLTVLAGTGSWWFWRRRRSRTVAVPAAADDDSAGDEHARQRPPPAADEGTSEHPHHDESLAPSMS